MANSIWLYWENRFSKSMPAYLELCLESVRRHRGAADVVLVTPETLNDYLPPTSMPDRYISLSANHRSDYLRMRLLRDYGGMWIDIDTVVFQSLSEHVLKRLEEAELVSPSEGLAQALFASRANGAFVSEAVEALEKRFSDPSHIPWGGVGADLVYPIARKYPHAVVHMKCWLFGWRDWQKYLEPGPVVDYSSRLACMLYNKYLFEPLKDVTRSELLSRDWLISSLLRHALA